MKRLKALLISQLIVVTLSPFAWGQQPLIYNHFYFNPYLYNPSLIAPSGYTELFINYRNQWSGIDGAPTTATVNVQIPFNYKAALGVNFYNDQAGVLRTTSGMLSFAYSVYFGQRVENNHRLSFGLSAGVTNSYVDINKVDNPDDPAIANNNTLFVDGQVGLSYQFKGLKIGFSIPRLFRPYVVSDESFAKPGIEQLDNTITSISYNFNLGPKVSFEPFLIYRTLQDTPAQYEALGILRYDNMVWVGGGYREDYGATGIVGLNIKGIKLAYAYEFAPQQVSNFGSGTHEIQLGIKLGRKKERPQSDLIAEEPEAIEPEPEETEPATEPVTEPEVTEQRTPEVVTPPVTEAQKEPEPAQAQPEPQQPKPDTQPKETAPTISERRETVDTDRDGSPIKVNGRKMPQGHYTVIGVFSSLQNAQRYRDFVTRAGYPAEVGNYPAKNYYFVYVNQTDDLDQARQSRDTFRSKSEFSFAEAWILTIE